MTVTEETPKMTVLEEPEESPEATKPAFKIDSAADLLKIMQILEGIDPEQVQALAKFINLDDPAERSYFPDQTTSICIGQLKGYGEALYGGEDWNPFTMVAEALAIGFMGYKGFKSNQWVDMTRQTHDLASLSSASDEAKQSVLDKILGRGKE